MTSPMRLLIFAKAPLPGLAKTRLIPALGTEGAANLAARLLETTVSNAIDADLGEVELCVTPALDLPAWQTIRLRWPLRWSLQGEGDLGARLARACEIAMQDATQILLMGTDCIELDSRIIKTAAEALRHADAVIVPATDGGYVLLGLTRFSHSLFQDISWSTDTVFADTLTRMQALQWKVTVMPALNDIDEPADLRWLPSDFPAISTEKAS